MNVFVFFNKITFNINDKNISVYHDSSHGPSFGNYNDINIISDYKNSGSYNNFPSEYEDTLKKGKSIFTGNLDNNKGQLTIKEKEVFKLNK